ncbi:MAG: aldehyde dehydrogenase [Vibrio sp.]
MNFQRINPINGELASECVAMTVEQATQIAMNAQTGFEKWAQSSPIERRSCLNKAADELEALTAEFVTAMKNEIGATESWAMFNVTLAASMLREAASLTTHIKGEVIPSNKPGCWSMAVKQPVGVILGIAPWNAPIILGVRAVCTALACGNSVILKASEICPKTHSLIIDALAKAGFPEHVVNCVTNKPDDAAEIVGALIDAKEVKRINFTGSTEVGRIIAQRAGKQLKPCLLELGGKAPLLVLEDADLDEAVKAAAFGAFMNQGQICMSTERLIVVDAIADQFVQKFRDKVATLTAGDPTLGTHPLGAVVSTESVTKVNKLIKDAVSKGAELINGGASDSILMDATVLDFVTKEMNIYHDESFGPIVSIIRAKDKEHAIEIANDSQYGLSSSIFTQNIATALDMVGKIHSGICHINGATVHDEAQMPFGGVGDSGYGRFGGQNGINEFTETRWVTIETKDGHFPI